jgi:hypothetical protein
MKPTDFAPRVTPFITYLSGRNLVGIEVGCDVGAHAEALLVHCDIEKLYLVDTFDNPNLYWYLKGRLDTKPSCRGRFEIINTDSHSASVEIGASSKPLFDFVYIDITHEYSTVRRSLFDWWPLLKKGGILGYRNYSDTYPEIVKGVTEFTSEKGIDRVKVESYQAEIMLFK